MKVVAPASQRTLRDLALLEGQCEVVWLGPEELAAAIEPMVCSAQIVSEPEFRGTLDRRMTAGYGSILLPRFQAGDLSGLLGADQSIRIGPGEASETSWHDGTTYEVPARASIQTALGYGRWLSHRDLCAGLAWRRTAAHGTVVICTAACCQRHPSISQAAQQSLLLRLLEALASQTRLPTAILQSASLEAYPNADAFIKAEGPDAAMLLLARYIDPEADPAEVIDRHLHCNLSTARLAHLQARCPAVEPSEIPIVLQQNGWGSHLRACAQAITSKGSA